MFSQQMGIAIDMIGLVRKAQGSHVGISVITRANAVLACDRYSYARWQMLIQYKTIAPCSLVNEHSHQTACRLHCDSTV